LRNNEANLRRHTAQAALGKADFNLPSRFRQRGFPCGKAVFATLSARVGSIGDNRLGGLEKDDKSRLPQTARLRFPQVKTSRKITLPLPLPRTSGLTPMLVI
tara:strand:+ start:512 stop:817 length:306 start_codon:yes stop_codon:yes gene_type:complete